MNFIDGERLDRNRYTTEYQELYFEGKLSSSLTFLPSSQNSPQEKYYSQGYSNSNRNRKAMRSGNGEFFNGLGGESSTPINTAVKSLENAIPHRGKSSHREDNVICFQYLYDGQHTTDPAMSDQNNNRAATCSEGVSSEFYSNDDQTDLSKVDFVTQQSELDDFCQSVATTLGTGLQQDSRVLESYFAEMQSSNSRDVHSAQENGSINLSISSAKEFHGGKRQNDKNYICSSTEDKQNPFSKHVVYGGVGFEKAVHNPISTTQPLESREFDENGEVKGKKNGELTHSREGSAVGTAVEVEILQPQANFQQRSLIHKLGRSEDITNTSLDQVNSMLIAVGEGSNEHSRNIQISERILIPSRDQSLYGRDHSPKSSLLAEDFMSPDHQTAISRGSSSGRSDICNEMQSLPDDVETNSDDIMAEHEQSQQPSSINDKKQSRNDKQLNEFMTEGNINRNHPDSSGDSPPNNEAQQSRDTCLSDTPMQQNGDAQQAQKQNADNPNLGKHIYPWMKESRQNTRRKQSTSSNSSSNGDKSSKRERTAYTNSQLVELEKEFHFNRYLCRPRRIEMAQMLNLTERQIKIWFQNRRMKYKKDQKLKAMPMSSMGREGSYYHQHHHPPNMNPEALFSRSNDHRHYSHSGHMHTSDTSGSMHGGMECSTGGRCYHGHRHGHGSHISQDSPNMIHQSLSRSSSTPFEGMNKAYPASNHKGNTNGRLTSPSSSSSNGTLSPGNGRSSGSFSSDVGMRSTPGSGTNQGLIQTGCGYLSHAVSPGNSMDDESHVMRGEKNNSGTDAHRPMNHSNYDLSLVGHGLSAFHRRVDDRMSFPPGGHTPAGQIPASSHYLGNYERQKSTNAVAMLTEAPSSHSTVHSRYGQVHNPLESLTDCVHRSPRQFLNQPLQFGHHVNGSRHPSADGFSSPFSNSNISFDRSRFERHVNHSPLDFSRSKSTSPRVPPNDVFINNRLTHL